MRRMPTRLIAAVPHARRFLITVGIVALALYAASGIQDFSDGDASASFRPFQAPFSFGVENSWVRVQNIGSAPANVTVRYYDANGRQLAQDTCPSSRCPAIGRGQGWTFFQGQQASLPRGYAGSAVIDSDQPIVLLQAKDVRRGGRFSIGGDTSDARMAASTLYLPLTAFADGPDRDWNGRFAIQNMTPNATACVTITYLSNYGDRAIRWDPYLPGHGSALSGCPNGGRPIPPGGTLLRTAADFGVHRAFTGSVKIETHRNAQGTPANEQLLVASADTWNSRSAEFASYAAVPESRLGRNIVLPLVDREVGPFNGWSTHFQIINKEPSRPARVTIRFDGFEVTPSGNRFVSRQNTVTVRAARMCFQERNDFANCLAPGQRLPRSFVGTARLTSTEPIAVVVNRGSNYNEIFTNYIGFRPEDGARRVLLPVLNKNHGPHQGRAGWNSWFRIGVADGGSANVRIRYFGLDLPGGEQAYTVRVNREHTVFQHMEGILPNGFAGTAILESDRPIVALATLHTDVFAGDTDVTYSGIALD
jgi:hypothetical protein